MKTRLAVEQDVDRGLATLSSLEHIVDEIKPLALDFYEALRCVIDDPSLLNINNVITLTVESLSRLNDQTKKSHRLERCLAEIELDKEVLVSLVDKEKKI